MNFKVRVSPSLDRFSLPYSLFISNSSFPIWRLQNENFSSLTFHEQTKRARKRDCEWNDINRNWLKLWLKFSMNLTFSHSLFSLVVSACFYFFLLLCLLRFKCSGMGIFVVSVLHVILKRGINTEQKLWFKIKVYMFI